MNQQTHVVLLGGGGGGGGGRVRKEINKALVFSVRSGISNATEQSMTCTERDY